MNILFLCLLLAGSFVTSWAQAEPVEDLSLPFSITIGPQSQTVKADTIVSISVRLTNRSGHSLNAPSLYFEGVDNSYEQITWNRNNELTKSKQTGQKDSSAGHWVLRILEPGKSVDSLTRLSPEYDMSEPGQYMIQLSRSISGDPNDDVVKSNKIIVTVTR